MLRTRVLTTVAGLPVLLGCVYLGGAYYAAAVAALAVAAYVEAARLLSLGRGTTTLALGLVGVAGWLATVGTGHAAAAPGFLAAYLGVLLSRQVLRHPAIPPAETAGLLLAATYVGLPLAHFIAMRALPDGFRLTLVPFVLTWAFDTSAYFAGRACGRHKMTPRLSPGKSWEGALAGSLSTFLVAAVPFGFWPVPPTTRMAAAALVIAAGQFGDLAESSLKRFAGLKDSGMLLPGHGGVLDRFDSLLFALPAVYYLLIASARGPGA